MHCGYAWGLLIGDQTHRNVKPQQCPVQGRFPHVPNIQAKLSPDSYHRAETRIDHEKDVC